MFEDAYMNASAFSYDKQFEDSSVHKLIMRNDCV